jgi:hypothetical protein
LPAAIEAGWEIDEIHEALGNIVTLRRIRIAVPKKLLDTKSDPSTK